VYVLPRKAAEERQRFDKTQMLSFLPPVIGSGANILRKRINASINHLGGALWLS
jgi:hypothetical protein